VGALTAETIVSEGLLAAGDTSLTTRGLVWLNRWLRSAYRAWPWPFLYRRGSLLALSAGTTALSVGNGALITPPIMRIEDPLWVYKSDKTARQRARVVPLHDGDIDQDVDLIDTTLNRGMPQQFRVRADTAVFGKWSLIPWPVPDQAYLVALDYHELPADVLAANTPLYPNDETMMKAVEAAALRYNKEWDAYGLATQELRAMSADDRVAFGSVAGLNDRVVLDPNTFK